MIRSKLLLFLFTASLPGFVSAQLTVSVNSGIGTYRMDDLKSLQQSIRSSSQVNAQITSSFPSYWFYEISVANRLENNLVVGGTFSYGSTGGRVYYSDYSGSLWFDQLASFYSITGSLGKGTSLLKSKLNLLADLRPGITITNLKMMYNEILGSTLTSQNSTFHSVNFIIQPTINATYDILENLKINTFVGYNLNLAKGNLDMSEHGSGSLTNNGHNVQADWSGLRAGAGISFKLNSTSWDESDKFSAGLGLGLDYGGIGANFLMYPHNNVGIFVGGGYALAGFGTNAGVKVRFGNSNKGTQPYLTGMYGYNAAVAVSNATAFNKLFYGPSVGLGIDTHPKYKTTSGYWTFALLVPIRGSDVDNYINSLKAQGIQFKNTLLPVGFSVGYRIVDN